LEAGRCLLDLRTVAPEDDERLVEAVLACTS
jgi:L-seryl-tRNA(Ser) seleniumtransferase